MTEKADLAPEPAVERLRDGSLLLSNCRIGEELIKIVLIRPQIGVALIQTEPGWSANTLALLHAELDAEGFSSSFPGSLPIVHLRLYPENLPQLNSLLHDAFASREPLGIRNGDAWAEALLRMLTRAGGPRLPAADNGRPVSAVPDEEEATKAPPRRITRAALAAAAVLGIAGSGIAILTAFNGDTPPAGAAAEAARQIPRELQAPQPAALPRVMLAGGGDTPPGAASAAVGGAPVVSHPVQDASTAMRPEALAPPAPDLAPRSAEAATEQGVVAASGAMLAAAVIPAAEAVEAVESSPEPPDAPQPASPLEVQFTGSTAAPMPVASSGRPDAELGPAELAESGTLSGEDPNLAGSAAAEAPVAPRASAQEPTTPEPPVQIADASGSPALPSAAPTEAITPLPEPPDLAGPPPWSEAVRTVASTPASEPQAPLLDPPALAAPPPGSKTAKSLVETVVPIEEPPAVSAASPWSEPGTMASPAAEPSAPQPAPPIATPAQIVASPVSPAPPPAPVVETVVPIGEPPAVSAASPWSDPGAVAAPAAEPSAPQPAPPIATPAQIVASPVSPAPLAPVVETVLPIGEPPAVSAASPWSDPGTVAARAAEPSAPQPAPQPAPPVAMAAPAVAPPARPAWPAPIAAPARPSMDPAVLDALMRRGDALLQLGDISGARRFFERAANAGSAQGARAMAESYDPRMLARRGVVGLVPDRAAALTWYRLAAELGSTEAVARIATLEAER